MARSIDDLIKTISGTLSYGEVLASEQLARISAAIAKARIERGMTQKEFAEFMNVSQTMVSKWESEDYNFTVESIANICEKLDWDMSIEMKPRSKAGFSHTKNTTMAWKTNSDRKDNLIKLFGAA